MSVDLRKVLSLITMLTCKVMQVDACCIRLIDRKRENLVSLATHGLSKSYPLRLGEGIDGLVAKIGEPMAIYDLQKNSRVRYAEEVEKEGFRSCLSIPTKIFGKVSGVISLYTKRPRRFTNEEIKFMMILANQAVSSAQEIRLTEDLEKNYFNTIHTLVLAVEAKDPFMKGHSRRVTNYAIRIAQRFRLSEEKIKTLYYSGELHDIGKIWISDEILNKPGKLTEEEYKIVKLHSVKGVQMLEPLKFLEKGLPIVRHHHERYDGNGYPDRIKGKGIPLEARILACTDAFDAMTSDRPYRKRRLTLQEAIEELRKNSGTQFDPEVVRAFVEILPKETGIS